MKFDNIDIEENLKKMYPEPHPEIWEKWQAPQDQVLEKIRNEVKAVYNEGEEQSLKDLIEAKEAEINRLQRRLDKDLLHDDSFKIEMVIHYFEITIRCANELLNEITEISKDGRVRYTKEMKEEAKKYYSDNKKKADEMASNSKAKTWVENKLIPHLANKFNKDEDYFNESTLRRNWLELTA
jgi:hypothetical protein